MDIMQSLYVFEADYYPAAFINFKKQIFRPYIDLFVILFITYILIYS